MSLFHYTDANAALSILRDKQLWLTDIRFLNDSEEATEGALHIESAIRDLPDTGDEIYQRAKRCLSDFSASDVLSDFDDMQMFVSSFSRTKDSLSQWRSYGLYAIEFDQDYIEDLPNFRSCEYELYTKKELAKELVELALSKMMEACKYEEYMSPSEIQKIIWELGDYVCLFKHESFREESEVRLITQSTLIGNEVHYRTKGDLIIPFQKLSFPIEAIKAVHVGPMKHQDLAITSLKSLLSNTINKYNQLGFRIDIIASKIPYRTL